MKTITYQKNSPLDLKQVIELYRDSTLGKRRPIDNIEVMEGMIKNSNLIITAWKDSKLVGISRTLTDFFYVAYLADLAVHCDYQKQGIGKELITQTRNALKPTCFLTLLSAPQANEYYPKIGFEPHPRAWVMNPAEAP